MRVPQNGCFVMDNPFEVDDLGVTTILGHPEI